jgi:hypothetical protein
MSFMERVRHKMEEAIQKRKRLQEQSQANLESRSAKDKSQYSLALGWLAAGFTLAVMVWFAKSIVIPDHSDMSATDRAVAIERGEIKKSSDEIAMLNERVDSMARSVSSLEAQLTHVMALSDSIAIVETKRASSSLQQITETGKEFIPTHTVKTRVNLRPSASLNTTPITVLNIGTEVEYISESDGWYYVNTQSHGAGWCSSEYLSPLLPSQRKSSAK